MRPSWDETWMQVAWDIAQRSPCCRARCGAVIVDASNRIVATGYNGPPANWHPPGVVSGETCDQWCTRGTVGPTPETVKSYADCPAIHGEANALMFCDRKAREGGTIYVTSDVCWTCGKMIANSGLRRVVMAADGDRDYRDPGSTVELLRACGLDVLVWP